MFDFDHKETLKTFIEKNKADRIKEFEYAVLNFRKYFPRSYKMDLISIPDEYISTSFWTFGELIKGNIYHDFCEYLKISDIKFEIKKMDYSQWDRNYSWLENKEALKLADQIEIEKIFKHRDYSENKTYAIVIKYEE